MIHRALQSIKARGHRPISQRWAYRVLGTLLLAPLLLHFAKGPASRLLQERGVWVLLAVLLSAAIVTSVVLELLLGRFLNRLAPRVNRETNRRFEVLHVFGVPILVDWTVIMLLIAALPSAWFAPALVASFVASSLLVMLVHELGHVFAIRRFGGHVISIEMGVVHGRTTYFSPKGETPPVPVAWGGVVAQLLVAVPFGLEWLAAEKDDLLPRLAALYVLGPWNALIAGVNLLPMRGLDGETAWKALRRSRGGGHRGAGGWKT